MSKWQFTEKSKIGKIAVTSTVFFVVALCLVAYTGSLKNVVDKVVFTALPSIQPHFQLFEDSPPKFKNIANTDEKKRTFFNYVYPIIVEENSRLLTIREAIAGLRKKSASENGLNQSEKDWLKKLNDVYRVDSKPSSDFNFNELLDRVDYIPPGLAMAQAAIESGWGSSRFAEDANNYFGHWCFTEGCGLVPKYRNKGAVHEVRKFKSVKESVVEYIRNLNTQNAYTSFRQLRSNLRSKTKLDIDARELAMGLINYSQEREHYVRKVQSVIEKNKLNDFIQKS